MFFVLKNQKPQSSNRSVTTSYGNRGFIKTKTLSRSSTRAQRVLCSVALLMSYYAHWCTCCTESPATAMTTIESACFVALCSHLEQGLFYLFFFRVHRSLFHVLFIVQAIKVPVTNCKSFHVHFRVTSLFININSTVLETPADNRAR